VSEPFIQRHRTAIHRTGLSRPMRLALRDGIISDLEALLDYGCGHGDDIANLRNLGVSADGWDPAFRAESTPLPADIVNIGYVINVIEDSSARAEALQAAWALSRKVLVVSARLAIETKDEPLTPYADGGLTRTQTFQKYYAQAKLMAYTPQQPLEWAMVFAPDRSSGAECL
jgi:DNA phosphorothioation-associated putative methyltransferase